MNLKCQPFLVPGFVRLAIPGAASGESPSFPLSEVGEIELAIMCEEFTQAVFEKAGKQRPPEFKP